MFDLIIKKGMIYDGTGAEPYLGDIGVIGDRIEAVGDLSSAVGRVVLQAEGKAIAPGFIDIHSHSDPTILANPRAESKIRQGVTTEVPGQCGSSAAPIYRDGLETVRYSYEKFGVAVDWNTMAEYYDRVNHAGVSVNVAPLIGLGTVRMSVVGHEARRATSLEMDMMKDLIRESMKAGAFGVSSGLIYPPGCFTETNELIELAKTAGEFGGIYVTHIRGESDALIESVAEAIAIGKAAGVKVHISHHKAAGVQNWGKVDLTLKMIEEANAQGVDVAFDVYPYVAGNTSITALIPAWAHDGGTDVLLKRLNDQNIRDQLTAELETGIPGWENFAKAAGWDNILIVRLESPGNKYLEGKTIAEAASIRKQAPQEFVYDLILEEKGQTVSIVMFMMCEDDVEKVLAHPLAMIGSDSGTVAPYGVLSAGKPHPRAYGTFARVLGRYVRERGIMPLAEGIHKMTWASAQRMCIKGRGKIEKGYYADLVLFDPDTIMDQATFQDPHQYAIGVDSVVVNGKVTVYQGEHTGVTAGRMLKMDCD
jgi:N-acyl-D-amino-acid deacylase